jgi:hypothetical protein
MSDIEKRLSECRERLDRLQASLPTRLDARDISLRAQLPFYALYCRETLIWRMVELSRDALECYQKGNLASAVVLTRAAIETCSALWHLRRKIEATLRLGNVGEIGDYLTKLRLGRRNAANGEFKAIHVNDFIRAVEKDCEGFSHQYDLLSEYAHPNSAGTTMLYSRFDHDGALVEFGNNVYGDDSTKGIGVTNLSVALMFFEHSYNEIADRMPDFIKLCERELVAPPTET